MADEYLTVKISQGEVRGCVDTDYLGGKFYSFKGIPYAEPPVGKLRFKAPRTKQRWSGVLDALEHGNPCRSRLLLSLDGNDFVGSEDCLYLNVYTPKTNTIKNELKPVILFVHGGGFVTGSGSSQLFGPHYLVTEDVVFVTINYRIGALGFLAFYDPKVECPGNNGLKDILESLRWVKENIANFNGDPNNVTVFGQSAGAALVHYLTLIPAAKNYFHKVICHSGSANADWACDPSRPRELAEKMGCTSTNYQEMYDFLVNAPVDDILVAQDLLIKDADLREGITVPWCPTIEVRCESEPNLIVEHPFTSLFKGHVNDVPMLMGYCKDEGMFFTSKMGPPNLYLNPTFTDNEVTVPRSLHLKRGSQISKETGEVLKNFYYGDSVPSWENLEPFIKMMTDIAFLVPLHYAVKTHTERRKKPIYYFRFCVDTPHSIIKALTQANSPGAMHAEELAYLMTSAFSAELRPGSIAYTTVQRMVKMWTTFARTGDPNIDDVTLMNGVKWLPTERAKLYCLNIDEELTFGENPDIDRIYLWDTLVRKFASYIISYIRDCEKSKM